jgi:hypothetical protein
VSAHSDPRRQASTARGFFLLVAIVTGGLATYRTYHAIRLDREGEHTSALVLRCEKRRVGPGSKTKYQSSVVFTDQQGQEHRLVLPGYHPYHTTIPIAYPPGRPDKAVSDEGNDQVVEPFLLACISAAALLLWITL